MAVYRVKPKPSSFLSMAQLKQRSGSTKLVSYRFGDIFASEPGSASDPVPMTIAITTRHGTSVTNTRRVVDGPGDQSVDHLIVDVY